MDSLTFNIEDFEFVENEANTAEASVNLNPVFRWCKFILTDDQPNKNGHRIPQEEFDNLIKTGTLAPIKMAANVIKSGHDGSFPLGVISHLKKEDNKIKGLAALWSLERPEDVDLVVASFKEGKPLNLSWEVLYSAFEEKDGVKTLKDTALRATTFVGNPAYAGRTPILEVASEQENSTPEDNNLDEELRKQLEEQIAQLTASLAEKDQLLSEATQKIADLESAKAGLEEFKAAIELEKANVAKLEAVRAKFTEAGISKDEKYFEDNREKLLGMDEGELDFLLQEIVSFASTLATASQEPANTVKVPVITAPETSSNHLSLAARLREARK